MKYTETDLELATLEWLEELGYSIVGGPEIAPPPDGERPERQSYNDVVLEGRLWNAIEKFNPNIPADAKEEAFKKVLQVAFVSPSLVLNNKTFHSYLRDGVDVEYMRNDGTGWPSILFVSWFTGWRLVIWFLRAPSVSYDAWKYLYPVAYGLILVLCFGYGWWIWKKKA